jgi:hypothetical protein
LSTTLAAIARDGLEMLAVVYEADMPDKAAALARSLNRVSCLIAYTELLKKKSTTPWMPPGSSGSDGTPVVAKVAVWLPLTGSTKH